MAAVSCSDTVEDHHCDGFFADAPWCDEDDYASTQAPDSDDDLDLDAADVRDPGGGGWTMVPLTMVVNLVDEAWVSYARFIRDG